MAKKYEFTNFVEGLLKPLWEDLVKEDPNIRYEGRGKPLCLPLHDMLYPSILEHYPEEKLVQLSDPDHKKTDPYKCKLYRAIVDLLGREDWGVYKSTTETTDVHVDCADAARGKWQEIDTLLDIPLTEKKRAKVLRNLDSIYSILHSSKVQRTVVPTSKEVHPSSTSLIHPQHGTGSTTVSLPSVSSCPASSSDSSLPMPLMRTRSHAVPVSVKNKDSSLRMPLMRTRSYAVPVSVKNKAKKSKAASSARYGEQNPDFQENPEDPFDRPLINQAVQQEPSSSPTLASQQPELSQQGPTPQSPLKMPRTRGAASIMKEIFFNFNT